MATDGSEGTSGSYLIVLMSVAANIVLYGLLGSCAWLVEHLVSAPKK
jgi:hypothetical protein